MIAFALALFLSPELFHQQCASCHGGDARGTAKGPGLVGNPHIAAQSAEQLSHFCSMATLGQECPPSMIFLPPISISRQLPPFSQPQHPSRR